MRTTFDIDEDVLIAARALAKHQRRSIGQVVSELARKGLRREEPEPRYRNGIRLLPSKSNTPITLEMVNAWRDEEP